MANNDNVQQKPLPEGMLRLPDNKVRFQKGNGLGGRRKGALNKNTQLKQGLSLYNWKELKDYVETNGINRFIAEIERLEGKDYVVAYLGILPYVKGKVANIEVKDETGKIHPLDRTHSITIRDMRDGSSISVIST